MMPSGEHITLSNRALIDGEILKRARAVKTVSVVAVPVMLTPAARRTADAL